MDRESFKKYMQYIIEYDDYLDRLHKLGVDVWEREELGNILAGYIKLLEAIMEVPDESDNLIDGEISFWLYECDRGTADNAWVEYKGDIHYIRNLDELYDWLVFFAAEEKKIENE